MARKINTLQRIDSSEYPNGLPGKNALHEIYAGVQLSMNKSKTKVYPISHDDVLKSSPAAAAKLTAVYVDDAFHAKSFYGENNQYHAWTTRLIIDGKSYSYCIATGSFNKVRGKDILIN